MVLQLSSRDEGRRVTGAQSFVVLISAVVVISFPAAQQKAVGLALRIEVPAHDVAASVDPERDGRGGAWEIDRRQVARAEQEAMRARGADVTRCDIAVDADDVAPRVDATLVLIDDDNAGEIDRGEAVLPEHEEMALPVERPEAAYDLSAIIDVPQVRFVGAGVIDRRELAPAEQKAAVVAVTGSAARRPNAEATDDVAALVDPEGVGPYGARGIKRSEHAVPQQVPAPDDLLIGTHIFGQGVMAHDVAAVVDPRGNGEDGTRVLD